jgi:Tol biopolymer transport system component
MYNIDVSSLGMGLYPSFTADNKKILFVNGVPNDYSSARNVYIVNIDGTDLRQLTFSDDYIYSRPLNW